LLIFSVLKPERELELEGISVDLSASVSAVSDCSLFLGWFGLGPGVASLLLLLLFDFEAEPLFLHNMLLSDQAISFTRFR
jgi:hypothetical protein